MYVHTQENIEEFLEEFGLDDKDFLDDLALSDSELNSIVQQETNEKETNADQQS